MKYSNELKVGVALVLSALIFYIGVRYFRDLPLFRGTSSFYTTFNNASGLVSGNAVRINGVTVGSIDEVSLPPGSHRALIRFHVDRSTILPHGSTTSIGGFGALGVVRMDIVLGASNTTYAESDTIPSLEENGLDQMLERAPGLVGRADSLLVGASSTLNAARSLMDDPQSDLRQTLVAIQGSATALNTLLRTEQARITRVLEGVETLTGNLNTLAQDSLGATLQNVNALLARLDQNIAGLETTMATLNTVLSKIDQGEGTLGLLINDPSLYHQLDSTVSTLNRILVDFEQNPKRYLKDLKLIDVF